MNWETIPGSLTQTDWQKCFFQNFASSHLGQTSLDAYIDNVKKYIQDAVKAFEKSPKFPKSKRTSTIDEWFMILVTNEHVGVYSFIIPVNEI